MELTAESNYLLLRLDDYKVLKENLERAVPEQDVIVKTKTAVVTQLEKKVSSLEDDNIPLQKNKEELMRTHSEQKTILRRRVGRHVENIETHFAEIKICNSRGNQSSFLQNISELYHFSKDLRLNLKRRSKQKFQECY